MSVWILMKWTFCPYQPLHTHSLYQPAVRPELPLSVLPIYNQLHT